MAVTVDIVAADGHRFSAYKALPKGRALGSLVVLQEIFGVNAHMRAVCDGFARDGYIALAPALFDRAERDVELGYQPDDIARGRELRGRLNWEGVLADVKASAVALQGGGRLGVVGYCFGGTVAWLAATRLTDFAAAVGYYGGQIASFATEVPRCPTLLHFGEKDRGIPMTDVAKIRAAQPGVEIHTYAEAGHGFSCEDREAFHAESAELAGERTLKFLKHHLG